jgi:signal transduction histidine kinase
MPRIARIPFYFATPFTQHPKTMNTVLLNVKNDLSDQTINAKASLLSSRGMVLPELGLLSNRTHRAEAISPMSLSPASGLLRGFSGQKIATTRLARWAAEIHQSAVLEERNRIARDLHDTLAQGFTGVIMQLGAAEQALSRNSTVEAASRINHACELAQESLRGTRRAIKALRSQSLDNKKLHEALKESFQKMTEGTALRIEFIVSGQWRKLPSEHEENLLRIGQEALTNAIRHARASEFKAELVYSDREIRLLLRDNGCGFESAGRSEGFGLKGIEERIESIGGRFSVNSTRGAGTSIFITLQVRKYS